MKKKRNSKFQYGVRSKCNNKVSNETSTFEKNIENKNNRLMMGNFLNKLKNIKKKIVLIVVSLVLIIFELSFISLFNDNTKRAITDYQFILTTLSFVLTPIVVKRSIMNNDSQKVEKKKLELCDFILDSVLLVILGYLVVFSEMAEKTNMVKTILTESKNILNLIILLLTPIKIYYSSLLFHYSRKEGARK